MSPQPHEGPAEEGLSSTMLAVVRSPERIECLRHLLSGFSHRCRNSLNGIKMSLYLVRREVRGPMPPAWKEVERAYLEIERLFDHLQTIYRPLALTMVRSSLGELVAYHEPKWRSLFQSNYRTLQLDPPCQDAPGDFDPIHLGMGLDAVVAWRAAAPDAGRQARVSWRTGAGGFEVRWDETGTASPPPGDGEAERPRGTSSLRRADPLALPLLARIVAAHGGGTEVVSGSPPGFRLSLRWPQFHHPA